MRRVHFYTGCLMNDGTARQEAAWQYEASRFIRGVSWVFELVDTKLHDNGTRPVYTGCFMNSVTARHEIAWQCDVFRFMPGVSMHDGTARHELVSTRSYDYLEILNAWIAVWMAIGSWFCLTFCMFAVKSGIVSACVNILTPEFPDRIFMKFSN